MRGLVIWAQIKCRSVMELYRQLGKALGVPLIVTIWHEKPLGADIRKAVGFKTDEFDDISSVTIGDDFEKGVRFIESHKDWCHIFGVYQKAPVFRRLLVETKRRVGKVGVMSEAPCNMSDGLRGIFKEVYLRYLLRPILMETIAASDFFVNFSGDDDKYLNAIGWTAEKIIPFGYFPSPVPGSQFHKHTVGGEFVILSSGVMTWHRGVDILVEALRILSSRGVKYKAVITQKGPLYNSVKRIVCENSLPVELPGFVSLEKLIELYSNCSVYVGAGRNEPWGMRLNDALNCGAPLVVSRGMGGVKMVDDYGCGLAFERANPRDLADKLELMATNKSIYSECVANVDRALICCSPEHKAKELISLINEKYPGWL